MEVDLSMFSSRDSIANERLPSRHEPSEPRGKERLAHSSQLEDSFRRGWHVVPATGGRREGWN